MLLVLIVSCSCCRLSSVESAAHVFVFNGVLSYLMVIVLDKRKIKSVFVQDLTVLAKVLMN